MGPKGKHPATGDLFQQPLTELINLKHPLVKLAELIDWSVFETRWAEFFPSRISETQIRSFRHGLKWVIQGGLNRQRVAKSNLVRSMSRAKASSGD